MRQATDLLDILRPGPRRPVRRGAPLAERLAAKIDYRGEGECWPWVGSVDGKGYGTIKVGGRSGETLGAHRAVYEVLVGPIPAGLDLDHECHNRDDACSGGASCRHRRCCNPAHLVAKSRRANVLAGKTVPARRAAQTHCGHGHEFTESNTYRAPGRPRSRKCQVCRERANRERIR